MAEGNPYAGGFGGAAPNYGLNLVQGGELEALVHACLLYTSPSPRDS